MRVGGWKDEWSGVVFDSIKNIWWKCGGSVRKCIYSLKCVREGGSYELRLCFEAYTHILSESSLPVISSHRPTN